MSLFRTNSASKSSGEAVYGFFECRHLLFNEESNYVICPSCGELLRERLPQDGRDKARLYLIQKKMKKSFVLKIARFIKALPALSAFFLADFISLWFLKFGDYGFDRFFGPSRYPGSFPMVTVTCFLIALLYYGGERYQRSIIFSLGVENSYRFWSSWPTRLSLFLLMIWLGRASTGIHQLFGEAIMENRYSMLSPAQQARGLTLYVDISLFSIWVFTAELLLVQLLDRIRTRQLIVANVTYLRGLKKK